METTEGASLALVALLLMGWSLVARRAERAGITAPMAFVVVGALLTVGVGEGLSPGTMRFVAEITLVLVLFHDASTVRLGALRHDPGIPVRLLLVGFPLALLLTTASVLWLLPAAGLAVAVLIAAAITPTDAGLGAPTILNPVVPGRVRRALNVESGLNDGLATPVVLAALSVLVEREGAAAQGPLESVLDVAAVPVALGLGLGLLLGLGGAWVTDASRARGLSTTRGRGLAVLAVPLLTFGVALLTDANAFIAAFVAGLVFGRASRCVNDEHDVSQTLETFSDIFSAVLWFLAGGLLVDTLAAGFRWEWLLLAVAALTVLRMGPVAVALIGTGVRAPTVAFLGWFGPRGVATIVFALLAVEELGVDDPAVVDVAGVTTLVVLVSVFAHGLSAGPLSARYGDWARRTHSPIESEPSDEPIPSRGRRADQDAM